MLLESERLHDDFNRWILRKITVRLATYSLKNFIYASGILRTPRRYLTREDIREVGSDAMALVGAYTGKGYGSSRARLRGLYMEELRDAYTHPDDL